MSLAVLAGTTFMDARPSRARLPTMWWRSDSPNTLRFGKLTPPDSSSKLPNIPRWNSESDWIVPKTVRPVISAANVCVSRSRRGWSNSWSAVPTTCHSDVRRNLGARHICGEESQTPSMHFHRGEGRNSNALASMGSRRLARGRGVRRVALSADHIGPCGANGSAAFIATARTRRLVATGRPARSFRRRSARRGGRSSPVALAAGPGRAPRRRWRGGRRRHARSGVGHPTGRTR